MMAMHVDCLVNELFYVCYNLEDFFLLFDVDSYFDVKEGMHSRNQKKPVGAWLLLSRSCYNCPPKRGI